MTRRGGAVRPSHAPRHSQSAVRRSGGAEGHRAGARQAAAPAEARPGRRHPLPSAGGLDRPQAGRDARRGRCRADDHRRADRRATIARAAAAARSASSPRTRPAITSRSPISTIRAGRRSSCRSASRGSSPAGSTATARNCRSSIRTMSCRPPRPPRSRSASRSIRCPKGSPTTGSAISPARRWRAGPELRRMDRAEPEGAAGLAGLGRGAGRPRIAIPPPPRRASGSLMTRCSPTSSP